MTFAIGGALGAASWPFRPGAAAALRQPPGSLGARRRRAVRLPRALFHRAEDRAAGRSRPDQLPLAAADRAVLGARCRASGCASTTSSARCSASSARSCCSPAAAALTSRRNTSRALRQRSSRPSSGRSIRCCRAASRPCRPTRSSGFCLGTAVLAAIFHLAVRGHGLAAPLRANGRPLLALGIGPVGAAFYAWDFGVKRGDIRVLGAASYAAPVLSTALLVAGRFRAATSTLILAAALITAAAFWPPRTCSTGAAQDRAARLAKSPQAASPSANQCRVVRGAPGSVRLRHRGHQSGRRW